MKAAEIDGQMLPWRDVLHEGPMPADLTLGELSKVRAQFNSERGWGDYAAVYADFVNRDQILSSFRSYDKVILWFEHDLYDQLQLLQILDWFNGPELGSVALTLICTERYLGQQTPDEMNALSINEEEIKPAQLRLAADAWSAFRASTLESWCALLDRDTSSLPFLDGAIVRLLEEYPSCHNGLSRTASQALSVIANGVHRPGQIFAAVQKLEQCIFMGDASFWFILNELIVCKPSLINNSQGDVLTLPVTGSQHLTITASGLDVLSGQTNWLDMHIPERWFGGVQLCSNSLWCWETVSASVKRCDAVAR